MREVGRSERLRRDATGLEQLERYLPRRREFDATADHEHPPRVGEGQRQLGCRPLEDGEPFGQCGGGAADPVGDCHAVAGEVAGE